MITVILCWLNILSVLLQAATIIFANGGWTNVMVAATNVTVACVLSHIINKERKYA